MKPSLLTSLLHSVGGLGLVVGVLLWPTVSQAQGFCYIVDADGRVTNLDDLCASGGASELMPPQSETPQSETPQSETPGADSAQPGAAPQVRGFTIIVTPTDADPSEAAAETLSDSVDAEAPGNESMGEEEPTGNEAMDGEPASEEPAGRQSRPGIPVEEITIPDIEVPQIQTPAAPSSSTPTP